MKLFLLFFLLSAPAFSSLCIDQVDQEGTEWIHCPRSALTVFKNTPAQREILWQLPSGQAPRSGWPVVILSQGSWFPVEFSRPSNLPFGGFTEVKLIRELLDRGFAVVAPRATLNLGWITNLPHREYVKTADYKVLSEVLRLISSQRLGALDAKNLFATGVSGGGYNTSRLEITFPGKFRALAIQSGSYAHCLGPLCTVPEEISPDHAPTLFLHGERDLAVPLWSAQAYHARLRRLRVETEIIIDRNFGHGWIPEAPSAIADWFEAFRR